MYRPTGHIEGYIGDRAVLPVGMALERFLARCPDAMVGAVSGDASARPLPPPSGLVPRGHPVLDRPLVDVVQPGDRKMVAKVWARARLVGAATAAVTLATDPPEQVSMSFFDVRDQHGVLVVVLAAVAPDLVDVATLDVAVPPPVGESARVGHVWKDGTAMVTAVDPSVERLLGWSAGELIGRRTLELIHPDDQELAIDNWLQMLDFPGPGRPVRLRHQHKDGRWLWMELTNHNRLTDPENGDVVAAMIDISEEVAAREAARASQQLLEQLTETLPIGLFHAGLDGVILYSNQQLKKMTGLGTGSVVEGWPWTPGGAGAAAVAEALNAARSGSAADVTVEIAGDAGRSRHCALGLRPLLGADGSLSGVTGSVEDVTERVVERRELEARAATDSLTGCLNRSAALALLQDALDDMGPDKARSGGVAVIFVDVDDFKTVNDRLGHLAGDALLLEVAARLRNSVRARDTVGRFGGDEFVVVASSVRSPEHALNVARWIASRTLRGISVDGVTIDVRASIGVAWTDQAGMQATWLVSQADAAMYRSKREHRCQPVIA